MTKIQRIITFILFTTVMLVTYGSLLYAMNSVIPEVKKTVEAMILQDANGF